MVTVDEAVAALRDATTWIDHELEHLGDHDLSVQAGPVEWSCWTTLDHVADCQLAYSLQIASGCRTDYLPVHGGDRTDDFVHFIQDLGVPGVREALPAFAELLCAQALTASADVRAFHPSGESDPTGFAAMGTVEMLLHGHDVLTGLGRGCRLPETSAATVLSRLFPHVELHETGADATLLWATGRGELPGRERVTQWRWDGRVHV
jgi:hypothetical protein